MEAYEQLSEAKPALADTSTTLEKFEPKGAIAFFAGLVILGLIIWFGIYFLMLSRI